jgi:hypothetical protein
VTPARPATVRVYFDADVLGLAKVLCPIRADFTYPGDPGAVIKKRERPACQVTSPAAKDPDGIRIVAARGWLILTRDRGLGAARGFLGRWRDVEPLIGTGVPAPQATRSAGSRS